ncbi:hypothetical protein BCV69DRAFT_162258 [Microstroma glucosiphilum]|uniref:Uncharacterized protein n=1 Tax=Pseudomicrostroma glucosiphilum TaxID=1684307 RepID=A0A316U9T3_9BASI|nr:hypothetical protein BCV69DRAFT_162258 [Pseudomicrostroma glucosiphilum]PWN22017.1 hypothetical protein BCV69DRAFT_162258 [Pseudomicrostroma glucosiphilum]
MLPVPSLPRTRAADSPASSSLLLTTKALVGREPPDRTLARRTGPLKPLSGLKSLNIELSDVWSADASKDITFLSEQPDCIEEASALVEQIPVDSPVTVRDMVRGFGKLDEEEVSCTAPLQQGIASDTPSPVLETKWMPDRPPARPEHNEGAEAEYDLEGDGVLQEPTLAEVNPGHEARKVSPLRHGSGGRDDSQQGLSIDDMNRQEEREACQVVSRFDGDLDCESSDARPLLFDNDGSPLHFLEYRDEEDVEDSHSLSSILPQWATERRGWMDYVVDEDEEQIAMQGVTSLEDTGEGRPISASTQAQMRDPPVTQRPAPALQTETSAQIPCPVRSQAQCFPYPRSIWNKPEAPDWQETRKRQAVDSIAAEDGKLMAVVKKVRSERAAAYRGRLSPIDMYLRMTGKEVPSTKEEMTSNPGAMRPIEVRPPQQEKVDEVEHPAEEDSPSDPAASPAEGYLAPSHTHHYLVSLRGLQNHRVMSHLTGRCNVSLIEATGVQDDWEWDLILDATSAVSLFKLSLLPAAMKVDDRTPGAGSKALASGSGGDLTLKQMLQSERFDSFLVVLEAYSSSGRQVEQTRPLLLAQDALKEYISRHLGSNKSVTIDVVRSPFEAAIRIRRWGDELQENAAREDEALLRQDTPTSGVMLTPAKIWEGRERWLSEAALEKGERERSRLQTLGLNIFASTIVLAVRTSLSVFLNDPPERRRDDFASVLGRPQMNKLNARLKREEGLRRPDGEGA